MDVFVPELNIYIDQEYVEVHHFESTVIVDISNNFSKSCRFRIFKTFSNCSKIQFNSTKTDTFDASVDKKI